MSETQTGPSSKAASCPLDITEPGASGNRGGQPLLGTQRLYAEPSLQLGLAYNGYVIIAVDTACAGLNTCLPLPC